MSSFEIELYAHAGCAARFLSAAIHSVAEKYDEFRLETCNSIFLRVEFVFLLSRFWLFVRRKVIGFDFFLCPLRCMCGKRTLQWHHFRICHRHLIEAKNRIE